MDEKEIKVLSDEITKLSAFKQVSLGASIGVYVIHDFLCTFLIFVFYFNRSSQIYSNHLYN